MPPGEGRAGASCGLQSCPEGAEEGRVRPGSGLGDLGRPISRRLQTGGVRGEEGPRGPAQSEGSVRGRRPETQDGAWAEAASGGGCGIQGARWWCPTPKRDLVGREAHLSPTAGGCDAPSWSQAAEGEPSAAPCRPGMYAAQRGAVPFWRGAEVESSVESRGFQIRSPADRDWLCDLGQVTASFRS